MKPLAACIIETRLVDLLGTIEAHLKFLPEDTDLFVSTGVYDAQIKEKYPSVTFIPVDPLLDLHGYNTLLTAPAFWVQFFKYNRVLIFQTDSKLLRKGIEEFYEWDYVGSPWRFQEGGGNGGLSLRNPKTMFDVCMKFPRSNSFEPEDIYFCNNMLRSPELGKLAPREIGMKWGVEAVFCLGSLGIHAPEKWLPSNELHQLLKQYDSSEV